MSVDSIIQLKLKECYTGKTRPNNMLLTTDPSRLGRKEYKTICHESTKQKKAGLATRVSDKPRL